MRIQWIVLSAALLLSCGKGSPSANLDFPEQALTMATGARQKLQVAIRSSPQPPVRGLTNFEFTVTDLDGRPVDGLQIAVQPWMPQMGHGTAVVPSVKDVGNGVYQVTEVYLFMAGLWELRTTFTGAVTDSVAPQFQIN